MSNLTVSHSSSEGAREDSPRRKPGEREEAIRLLLSPGGATDFCRCYFLRPFGARVYVCACLPTAEAVGYDSFALRAKNSTRGPRPMSDKLRRAWFQIHLSTAIVLMFVAGERISDED